MVGSCTRRRLYLLLQPRETLARRRGHTYTLPSRGWSCSSFRPTRSSLANQAWLLHVRSDVFASTGETPGFCTLLPIGLQHSYSLTTFSGHLGMEFLEHRHSVSLLWAIKYLAPILEKSSTKVTMYFLPELEAVCIGPHTSECTFSNRRLERISPRGFGLCLVALPCTQPSQKRRGSTFFRSTPDTSQLTSFSRTLPLTCAKDLKMAGLPPGPHLASCRRSHLKHTSSLACDHLQITTLCFVITLHVMSSNNILFPLSVMSRTENRLQDKSGTLDKHTG